MSDATSKDQELGNSSMMKPSFNLLENLERLKIDPALDSGKERRELKFPVKKDDTRKYQSYIQEANAANRSNEITLTSIIAYVMMSGWPGTQGHERRLRETQGLQRQLVADLSERGGFFSGMVEDIRDDMGLLSIDESLSTQQKLSQIRSLNNRCEILQVLVRVRVDSFAVLVPILFDDVTQFPAFAWISGSGDSGQLLAPARLVDYGRNADIIARVWSWASIDTGRIRSWLDSAQEVVSSHAHMKDALEHGMEICAEVAIYLQQHADGTHPWPTSE